MLCSCQCITRQVVMTQASEHHIVPWLPNPSNLSPCAGCILTLQVAAPLLRTLAAMHAVGVTHRDVKLENIFMDANGAVKLGDFDLAVFHHEAQVGLQQSASCFVQ